MEKSYPPDVRQFIEEKLKSGAYRSEETLLTAAVRVLSVVGEHHRMLHHDVQAGVKELDEGKGEIWDMNEITNDLNNRINKAA